MIAILSGGQSFRSWNNLLFDPHTMEDIALKSCFIIALTLTGLLCGASLDQSIKQLPARRTIGVKTFSLYAKAADLKNGIIWYAVLGIGAALFSITTAIIIGISHPDAPYALPLYLAGAFAVSHSICTSQAAPTYIKQKRIDSELELNVLFNKFERIQTTRSIFIALNLISFLWALIIIV
jgi:hypothetical protein